MTDEEINNKMERAVNKAAQKPKRRRKGQKEDPNKLWERLFEENLRKLGYIK